MSYRPPISGRGQARAFYDAWRKAEADLAQCYAMGWLKEHHCGKCGGPARQDSCIRLPYAVYRLCRSCMAAGAEEIKRRVAAGEEHQAVREAWLADVEPIWQEEPQP